MSAVGSGRSLVPLTSVQATLLLVERNVITYRSA
ncbi:MAG: hypothetical protein JWN84_3973, partial [Nocardioides sp.]|nr:hypothetical protein [Nocardioides sp.]